MGLDITAYSQLRYLTPQPETEEQIDDAYESDARHLYNAEGHTRLAPQAEGFYVLQEQSRKVRFRAGSYSGYNYFRNLISQFALGVPAATVWNNEAEYKGKPFYELINFADNEGAIGSLESAKLAADFATHRGAMAAQAEVPRDFMECYDEWAEAFAVAADGGAVEFH